MTSAAIGSMKILEIETFGRGGLTHYAYNLSCALAERGHEVTFATTAAYELEGKPLPANVRVIKAIARHSHDRAKKRTPWPALILNLARKFEAVFDAFVVTALARRIRPDVIHFHCTNPISLVYLTLLRRLGIPLVVTAHVVTPHEPIRFQTPAYRRIHRMGQLIIAHSDYDRNRLQTEFSVEPSRITVIPHGEYGFFDQGGKATERSDARRGLDLEPTDEVALFFGYIREYKGLDLLLEAWESVVAARPKARLLVAGDPVRLTPERRRELESSAESLGVIHRFEYVPFADVAQYFGAADVLVMPYRHISQSGVLYLALSMGLPVLASKVGALPEVLEDGESALFVPPEDSPALAKALERILGDEALRDRLAAGGRKVARDHSWPAIAERTEAVFAELANPADA